jgi:hypothetical protein
MTETVSAETARTEYAVRVAAAAWAALTFEPILAKSVAADVIISGAAITYDIPHLQAN